MLSAKSILGFIAALIGIGSAWLGWRIEEIPGESGIAPGSFPMLLGVILFFLGCALICRELFKTVPGKPFKDIIAEMRKGGGLPLAAIFLLYCIIFEYLPFVFSSFAFAAAGMWLLGERRWKSIIAVAAGAVAILYILFRYAFSVFLP